jgi:hypothetical protein
MPSRRSPASARHGHPRRGGPGLAPRRRHRRCRRPDLLDGYEHERRPDIARTTTMALRIGRLVQTYNRAASRLIRAVVRATAAVPGLRTRLGRRPQPPRRQPRRNAAPGRSRPAQLPRQGRPRRTGPAPRGHRLPVGLYRPRLRPAHRHHRESARSSAMCVRLLRSVSASDSAQRVGPVLTRGPTQGQRHVRRGARRGVAKNRTHGRGTAQDTGPPRCPAQKRVGAHQSCQWWPLWKSSSKEWDRSKW